MRFGSPLGTCFCTGYAMGCAPHGSLEFIDFSPVSLSKTGEILPVSAILRHTSGRRPRCEVDAATLAGLDQLEGHPRFYRRTLLRPDEHGEVATYPLTPAQVEGCLPIDSGCWRSHRSERPR